MGDDKLRFEADIDSMNLILLGIPNDIYNFVDAYKTAKAMWTHVRRLMQETDLSKQERDSRLSNEFDKFTYVFGKSIESVYEHFSRPMNDMDRDEVSSVRRNTGHNVKSSRSAAYVHKATKDTENVKRHDEVGINLDEEHNDFLLVDVLKAKELQELNASTREYFYKELKLINDHLRQCVNDFQQEFTKEVKEMIDIFDSMESELDETLKRNDIFDIALDRLLEVTLSQNIENLVMYSCVENENENVRKENEKLLTESNDVQESLLNHIKILENDFQRCQAQSIAFELNLQHKKEKYVFKNSWISKAKKLDDAQYLCNFKKNTSIGGRDAGSGRRKQARRISRPVTV
ncbi:hypothetical protein Tco_0890687 [Tanacetum coccineum]|uniref:Uncharacterized protein n=1 Tax=Tanacetum coccineum TaxID=301880 RepID=A0ABQ5C151_9ASTR